MKAYKPFIKFFLGTPKRFASTLIVTAIIGAVISPTGAHHVSANIVHALSPFVGIVASIGMLYVGYRFIMGRK